MDRTIDSDIAAASPEVFAVVSDLTTFPDWLDLVHRVEPIDVVESDPGPAFAVTLRATVGPFARSKRLRMCRTECDPALGHAAFERRETDGRDHAAWIMSAHVSPAPTADDAATRRCSVSIRLQYEGRMWSGLLDGVLDKAVERAARKLAERATG